MSEKSTIFRRKAMKFEKNISYLRTRPVLGPNGTWDYKFCSDPICFEGVDASGRIIYHYPENTEMGRRLKEGPRVLPTMYNDNNWESVFDITNGGDWAGLDYFSGTKAYRKVPVELDVSTMEEHSFNFDFNEAEIQLIKRDLRFVGPGNAVVILAANKHHVVVETADGKTVFLDERYAKPEDWEILD